MKGRLSSRIQVLLLSIDCIVFALSGDPNNLPLGILNRDTSTTVTYKIGLQPEHTPFIEEAKHRLLVQYREADTLLPLSE